MIMISQLFWFGEWYPVTLEDLNFIVTKCHGADRRKRCL